MAYGGIFCASDKGKVAMQITVVGVVWYLAGQEKTGGALGLLHELCGCGDTLA